MRNSLLYNTRIINATRRFIGDIMRAAAGVLIVDGDKILGFNRADNSGWSIPFGKVNLGESPIEAAIRECFEETGYIVEITDDAPFVQDVGPFTGYTFKAKIVGGSQLHYKDGEGYCEFINPSFLSYGGYADYNTAMLQHFSGCTKPVTITTSARKFKLTVTTSEIRIKAPDTDDNFRNEAIEFLTKVAHSKVFRTNTLTYRGTLSSKTPEKWNSTNAVLIMQTDNKKSTFKFFKHPKEA